MAMGGDKFAQKISPKAENYYKVEMYLPKHITWIKNVEN